MCNTKTCKHEGYNGRCIKNLHGIPYNKVPDDCLIKNNKQKTLLELQEYKEDHDLKICGNCKSKSIARFPNDNYTDRPFCNLTAIRIKYNGTCNLHSYE